MSNENYQKCKTCRFCHHEGNLWFCTLDDRMTQMMSTCGRYRPGSCENCSKFERGSEMCLLSGMVTDGLDVCSDFDPSGQSAFPAV